MEEAGELGSRVGGAEETEGEKISRAKGWGDKGRWQRGSRGKGTAPHQGRPSNTITN
jgi:hypothetical protein